MVDGTLCLIMAGGTAMAGMAMPYHHSEFFWFCFVCVCILNNNNDLVHGIA